jgi:hypothetical protein
VNGSKLLRRPTPNETSTNSLDSAHRVHVKIQVSRELHAHERKTHRSTPTSGQARAGSHAHDGNGKPDNYGNKHADSISDSKSYSDADVFAYPNAYSFTDTHSTRAIMPSLLFTDRNFYRYSHYSTA